MVASCVGISLGTYTKYTVLDGLATNLVNVIAIETHGNRWFGTEGRVTGSPTQAIGRLLTRPVRLILCAR